MKKVRIGAGSGYWGDMRDPVPITIKNGAVDFMFFDFLAELTMSILQRQKSKDASRGYIEDMIPVFRLILRLCKEKGVKIITNGGGANPEAGAQAVVKLAKELGLGGLKIAAVTGDDIYPRLDEMRARGIKFKNMDTGEPDIDQIRDRVVAANVYTGADSVIAALKEGADLVIGGRLSDNTLIVAPTMYAMGWEPREPYWDRIGAAITIGHILECNFLITGGYCSQWKQVKEMWHPGNPIGEIWENGEATISKVPGTGGLLNSWTVKEHLVYEVQDPNNYLMPDGIANFTTPKVEDIGENLVKVTNMTGKPRPNTLKVQIGYEDGWIGEGRAYFPWPDAWGKAKWAAEVAQHRLHEVYKVDAEDVLIDFIGVNSLLGPTAPEPDPDISEVGIRVVVRCKTAEEANKARRIGSDFGGIGPAGTAFIGPPPLRQVVSLWPCLVPREEIVTKYTMMEVK